MVSLKYTGCWQLWLFPTSCRLTFSFHSPGLQSLMLNPVWQQSRPHHYINTTIKLWQYWLKTHSTLFPSALKKTSLSSSHSYSEPDDRCRLIFFHIHLRSLWAWHDLCSPSHLIITLFLPLCPHSFILLLLLPLLFLLFAPPCKPLPFSLFSHPSLSLPLQSSLSNGDKGRPADYLSNGKKRKADEKEFMTDYVRHFHNTVKCLNNCRKVSPNSAGPGQIRPVVSVLWTSETCSLFLDSNWNMASSPYYWRYWRKADALRSVRDYFHCEINESHVVILLSALSLCWRRPAILKTTAPWRISPLQVKHLKLINYIFAPSIAFTSSHLISSNKIR